MNRSLEEETTRKTKRTMGIADIVLRLIEPLGRDPAQCLERLQRGAAIAGW